MDTRARLLNLGISQGSNVASFPLFKGDRLDRVVFNPVILASGAVCEFVVGLLDFDPLKRASLLTEAQFLEAGDVFMANCSGRERVRTEIEAIREGASANNTVTPPVEWSLGGVLVVENKLWLAVRMEASAAATINVSLFLK